MATPTKQLCVTGPRRDYNFVSVGRALKEVVVRAYMNDFTRFACGMALGIDTLFADVVLELKESFGARQLFSDMQLIAYVPFEGQEFKWPQPHQMKYTELLRAASEVIYTADTGYADSKYIIRNERMVNESQAVVAVYDGRGGGTGHCYDYALRSGKRVFKIDPYSGVGGWVKM